jgi:hypothetical protein
MTHDYNTPIKYSSRIRSSGSEYKPQIINYGYLPKYEKRQLNYSVDQGFHGEYKNS